MDKQLAAYVEETLQDCFGALAPKLRNCAEIMVISHTDQVVLFMNDSNIVYLTPPLPELAESLESNS